MEATYALWGEEGLPFLQSACGHSVLYSPTILVMLYLSYCYKTTLLHRSVCITEQACILVDRLFV